MTGLPMVLIPINEIHVTHDLDELCESCRDVKALYGRYAPAIDRLCGESYDAMRQHVAVLTGVAAIIGHNDATGEDCAHQLHDEILAVADDRLRQIASESYMLWITLLNTTCTVFDGYGRHDHDEHLQYALAVFATSTDRCAAATAARVFEAAVDNLTNMQREDPPSCPTTDPAT